MKKIVNQYVANFSAFKIYFENAYPAPLNVTKIIF